MKAISLWQPWASLWCSARKVHETRHWATSYRGLLLIHATKRFERNFGPNDPLRLILDDEFGGHWGMDLPTGALIGMVRLVACKPTETMPIGHRSTDDYHCGDFSNGRYAWQRSDYKLFTRPISYRGMQGLFEVPDTVLPIGFQTP